MRKALIVTLAAAILAPLCASALDANQMNYVELLPAQATAAVTGSVVNVSAYKGNAAFVFSVGATTATNYSASVTVKHCTTTNGTFTTVTNLAGTAVAKTVSGATSGSVTAVPCDLGRLHSFVKVFVSQSGNTNEVGAMLVAPMKAQ